MTEIKRLADLCDPARSICYGIVQPGRDVPTGLPIIRVADLRGNQLDLSDVMRVEPAIEAKYRRSRVKANDVLVSLVGSLGQVCIAPAAIEGWNIARAVGLIPARDRHHAEWIVYSPQSPPAQQFIQTHANTTVQATFNLKDLARIPIPYPAQAEREAAVEVLGALDDKIELNRRTNRTLEAMARALFRSWFVDFDPVHAKAGGRAPAHMDPATAALFPAGFGEDGLPEGWRTGPIYDVSTVIYGAPFASVRFNQERRGHPRFFARIRDLPNHAGGCFTDEVHPKEHLIRPADIVVGMDGEFRASLWHGVPTLMNQRVCSFVPKRAHEKAFLLFLLQPQLLEQEQNIVGTTVIHLGKKEIDHFTAIIPPGDVRKAYGAFAEKLTARGVSLGEECRTLAALRDALLPKLMSGELNVRDAERALAEAV